MLQHKYFNAGLMCGKWTILFIKNIYSLFCIKILLSGKNSVKKIKIISDW